MSSVKICVSVIYCLCVYISLGDAALATIRVLKISCYCSQNAVLQIAQNGLGLGGLQASAQRAGRSFLHPAAAALWLWQRAVGPQPIPLRENRRFRRARRVLGL